MYSLCCILEVSLVSLIQYRFGISAELFDGLRQNDVLKYYTHLLTGYTLNATFLREIVAIVKSLREANPSLIYGRFREKL